MRYAIRYNEEICITKKPILYIGAIKDVERHDSQNYKIKIYKGRYRHNYQYLSLGSSIELSLLAEKKIVDKLLQNPETEEPNIAFVASIRSVTSDSCLSKESCEPIKDIKIGEGVLLDYLYHVNMRSIETRLKNGKFPQ